MTVLLRVDATTQMGTGHVMRCFALAEALHDESIKTCFLCAEIPLALKERLEKEGCDVRMLETSPYGQEDADAALKLTRELEVPWIVVDGYSFDSAYQEHLKCGAKILWIDDYGHAPPYAADVILNQNPYAEEKPYAKRTDATRLLLGTSFALLRREFRALHAWKRETKERGTQVLLTLGGADPENITAKILDSLGAIADRLTITIPVGGGNPHADALEKIAKESSHEVKILKNVSDMTPLMQEADLAIAAGGTTSYELAFLQVPMLTTILAGNQGPVVESLAKAGCSISLGEADAIDFDALSLQVRAILHDPEKRERMSENGRRLVDGEGTDRVLMRLLNRRLRLRYARAEDSDVLLAWANDTETRAVSFSPKAIEPDEHHAWFRRKLFDPETVFFMALDEYDDLVGTIRFEKKNGETTLSFSLGPHARGKGLGKELVSLGSRKYLLTHPKETIHAYVKSENERSVAIFRKTGFSEQSVEEMGGHSALHFTIDFSTIPA